MKILVVSDSHGDDLILKKIANKHNDCDIYLHLGDSQSTKENIHPFISVKGNCDYFSSDFQNYLIINTPIGKLFAEHIPYYFTDANKLKKDKIKIYLYGHTHVKKSMLLNNIYTLNPGAIKYPRDGSESYAIIEINGNIFSYKFLTL